MKVRARKKVDATFNMSSMTDIVFLLLIFFIVLSTLVTPPGVPVELPKVDNKDKIIFNYINENYGTIIKETSDPNWLGNTSWEADNKKFYYNKILKFNKLVVEDLLITNNEYKGYF